MAALEMEDEQGRYNMSSEIKGLALIINNSYNRRGSEKDFERMKAMWMYLDFLPFSYPDLSTEEMEKVMQAFCKKQRLNHVDCLVVVLMSHGTKDGIQGNCEEKPLPYTRIFEMFNDTNCPSMKGKPKLIFIQACRGGQADGVQVDMNETDLQPCDEEKHPDIPYGNDTYVAYSTTFGFYSTRKPSSGSIFIRAIDEVFRKEADKKDFVQLMRLVKNKVSKTVYQLPGNNFIMEQPVTDGFLPKKLYLRKQIVQ